jgi:drug/metabolite transporter (DMT)-like permease
MSEPTPDRRALAILILGAVAIGWSPILVRLGGAGPAATGFWRLAFALPWFVIFLARPGAPGDGLKAIGAPILWLTGVFFAADLGFWHYGIKLTSVANATVLPNLTPVLVTIVAWLAFKERPRPVFVLGMAVAIAGAVGMAVFKAGAGGRAPNFLGDILSAVTAIWYAGYFLAVRQARARFSTPAVMLASALPGLPLLLIAAVLLREQPVPRAMGGWLALAALGFVHATGQGMIAWALGRLPTALAAVVVLVQPVVAAALGWWLFAEAMTPLQALAAALALTGVVIAQASRRPPEVRAASG